MKIVLYQHFHNGDILFNQPFVRILCKNNPNYQFEYCANYNSYLFSDIPNIQFKLLNSCPLITQHSMNVLYYYDSITDSLFDLSHAFNFDKCLFRIY